MAEKDYPFYIKATVILIGMYYLVTILNMLQGILVPFAFAVLFAILLNPLYNWLLRFKFPRPLAVLVTVLSGIAFFALIGYLLSSQVSQFSQSFPVLKVRFGQMMIRRDELNLTEISWMLHYSSVAHLSAQFKKITGVTPTQFKLEH